MMADLAAVLAAVCWAAANTCIARGATRGGYNGAFLSICLTMLIAGTFWLFGLDMTRLPQLDPLGVLWFAVAGALTIFLGRGFFHSSVQHLGAIRSSSVKRLVPFFTVVLGITWLGETLQPAVAAGMLLIFPASCCWWSSRDASPAPPAPLMPPKLPLVQRPHAG